MIGYATQYLEYGYCSKGVIMTLLPRSNQLYMERIRQFNSVLTSNTNISIVGWYWSKPFRRHMPLLQYYVVHQTDKCYRKAVSLQLTIQRKGNIEQLQDSVGDNYSLS